MKQRLSGKLNGYSKQLAVELITARRRQHLTQIELAKKADVPQAYISLLESGLANPTIMNFNKVVDELGLRLALTDNKKVS